jgi:Ca2+-binding RTX toxin-like protein
MLALMARRGSVVGLVALLVSVLAPATASHAAVPTCFGQPATWVGTPGDDTVGVHQLGDQAVVVTLGGDDTVRLGPGDNLVCTGSGNDSVFARSGNDEIATGSGNDEVAGQRGNDTILGGPGADALYGRYGANTIDGGGGNDTIVSEGEHDVMDGGFGADAITEWGGLADTVRGGPGADALDTRDYDSYDGIYFDGEPDSVDGGAQPRGSSDTCLVNHEDVPTGCERITVSYVCAERLSTVLGTPAADTIDATSGSDVVVTLGGNDVVHAAGDTVCTGSGDDVVTGADWVVGGGGNDRLSGSRVAFGSPGDDLLRGRPALQAYLVGGGGADDVRAHSPYADHLQGGPGDDVLDARDRDPSTGDPIEGTVPDFVIGGTATDRCSVNAVDVVKGCEAQAVSH